MASWPTKKTGKSSGTILIFFFFPAGLSHHGNSRNLLNGNRPSRQIFPREPATTGNSRDFFNWIFCPESAHHGISPEVNGPIYLLLSLYSLISNTFACTILDVGLDVGCKHFIVRVGTEQRQQQTKTEQNKARS